MFLKRKTARHLISELNHVIETYPFKERENLRICINERDFNLLESIGISNSDLFIYDIPILVKDVNSPILEPAIPEDSFETPAPAKLQFIS